MIPSPFIVGVGRSGTTLLRLMLDAHPEMAIPPETHFIPKAIRECSTARDPRRAYIEAVTSSITWDDHPMEEEELRRQVDSIEPFDISNALRAFYGCYASRFGKRRWGDKTPLYVRSMDLINGILPEAHFIHLIRDGRDVALSVKDLWFGPDSIEEAAKQWVSWIEGARSQAQGLPYYLELRYEDLVSDPETVLGRVCEFLDLPWDSSMMNYHEGSGKRMEEVYRDVPARKNRRAVQAEERVRIHCLTREPPQRHRVGRWRKEMDEADKERFENVAGYLLRDLGYGTD